MSEDSIKNIIEVQNISKSYLTSFKDETQPTNPFYALKNINFSLKKGDSLGIVGKNGAGKTTLLKILGGVTRPSEGNVSIFGNTVAVLDNNIGFNDEISGSENLIICAKLMGYSNLDIDQKKDEIIAFSGIGKFISQPIKTYSTGMQTRLFTSIALFSNADLLLIDEQLISGDIEFRKQVVDCLLEKLKKGVSIIMASHGIKDIYDLCKQSMILEKGEILDLGPTSIMLKKYANFSLHKTSNQLETKTENQILQINWPNETGPQSDYIILNEVSALSLSGSKIIHTQDGFEVSVYFNKKEAGYTVQLHVVFFDIFGAPIFSTDVYSNSSGSIIYDKFFNQNGLFKYSFIVPANFLYKGEYEIQLRFGINSRSEDLLYKLKEKIFIYESNQVKDFISDALPISIRPSLLWDYQPIN
jgi:ABC-type polysaccharide/polyol phosphate transport system ATPase subunit